MFLGYLGNQRMEMVITRPLRTVHCPRKHAFLFEIFFRLRRFHRSPSHMFFEPAIFWQNRWLD